VRDGSGDRTLRGSAADIAALLVLWAIAIALVDPRGDFALNDDWAYGLTVRRLLEAGVFQPPGWAAPTLLSQALWGAAASLPAGFSFTALRLSTLVLGGVAIAALYALARTLRAPRGVACVAALTMAFGPVFFALAHTFMTDVPFIAFALTALLFNARALDGGGDRDLALGCIATVSAVLCRQVGIVLPVAFAIVYVVYGRGALPARTARALLPLLLTGAALWGLGRVLALSQAPTDGLGVGNVIVAWRLRDNPPAALRLVRDNLFITWMYCGLFLAPALLRYSVAWRGSLVRSRWFDGAAAAAALAAVVTLWIWNRGMPLRGNVLIKSGLGPITLYDGYVRGLPNDGPLPAAFWHVVTAIAVCGAGLLIAQLLAVAAQLWRATSSQRAPRLLVLTSAAGMLAAVSVVIPFDRYYLPLAAMLAAALTPPPHAAGERPATVPTCVLLAAMAVFAVAGTHDYLNWNRARWQALQQLTEVDGISPRRIDGGFEFNGPLFYAPDYRPIRGKSWWWVVDDEFTIAMGPVPGFSILRSYPYARWLPPGTSEIVVLHRNGGS
jgi:4-amino-4-deoxy-L-arabinose transferase-like glycosyltransferase